MSTGSKATKLSMAAQDLVVLSRRRKEEISIDPEELRSSAHEFFQAQALPVAGTKTKKYLPGDLDRILP